MIVEQHGRTHPERVAAGPHREEVEVAEVAGVNLDEEQGSRRALSERPAGTTEDRGEHEHRCGRNEERVQEFGGPTSTRPPEPSRGSGLLVVRKRLGRRTAPPCVRAGSRHQLTLPQCQAPRRG